MSKEFLSFTSNDVEITDIKPVYRGFFTMNQYQFKHKCFNGEWSDTVTREIFERGHAVGVLPYDPVLQEFVLIEQVRIGALMKVKHLKRYAIESLWKRRVSR